MLWRSGADPALPGGPKQPNVDLKYRFPVNVGSNPAMGPEMHLDFQTRQFKPPLVTLVVINWNYEAFVGSAISSILAQDYPSLDLIVVDNGSEDKSRQVIDKTVAGDPRVRTVFNDSNLGQLGAFFRIFDDIRGEFVGITDADDVIAPNFVSSHVQAHLAMPRSVAFTSSNVFETNAEGKVITGGNATFGRGQQLRARSLPPPHIVPRLKTISEFEYQELSDATAIVPPNDGGWFWGPGTSNLYRRSIVSLIHQRRYASEPYIRAADTYLNFFCHALAGSALIFLPLSYYRIHSSNYFALRESVQDLGSGKPDTVSQNELVWREMTDFVLRNAGYFVGLVGSYRFWGLVDQLSGGPPKRSVFHSDPVRNTLADQLAPLCATFGEEETLKELFARIGPRSLMRILKRSGNGHVSLSRRRIVFALYAARRFRKWFARNEAPPPKQALAPRAESRRGHGPVAVLSRDPPVFKTGIAFDEYLGIAAAFGRRYGNIPAGFVIYPTWTIENPESASRIADAASTHRRRFPDHRLLFLGNTQTEADLLSSRGQPAVFLNKNIMVSEKVFRPLAEAQVEFDAVYNGRFVKEKRHELTVRIERVAYLSYGDTLSGRLPEQRSILARVLAGNPRHRLVNPVADGLPVRLSHAEVNSALNKAAVGLVLSEAEGSNYASMEYMLAGLPVVSTPSKGGRDVFFDDEFCIVCEPDAAAVSEAVVSLKARNLSRDYIRAKTLKRIEPDRKRFMAVVRQMVENLGGQHPSAGTWPYGDVSGLVSWADFGSHLLEFEKASEVAAIAAETSISATILGEDLRDMQLQPAELRPVVREIVNRPGCSLLVFGCGNDSPFWERINHDGRTAFLEDDPIWLEQTRSRLPGAEVYPVRYDTRRADWLLLLDDPEKLHVDLPPEVSSERWDVILVDGPAGYEDGQPGRMKSIFVASQLVASGGCVFVHDCDRQVERQYCERYLGRHRRFVEATGRALLNGYRF
jgi:uncharacterized protein (TIGR01627 family)